MKRAFTLVETVIALSLTLILAGGLFCAFASGFKSWRKIAGKASTLQVENIIAERLCREIRSAAVLPGSTGTQLKLQIGAELVSYELVEGKVRRKKGTTSAYFTSENEIKKLNFSYPTAGSVRVELDGCSFLVAGRNR